MSLPDYDVSYHWTRGDKTGWAKIGAAFVNNKGRIKIYLEASPVPGLATKPGELMLFPKLPEEVLKEKIETSKKQAGEAAASEPY